MSGHPAADELLLRLREAGGEQEVSQARYQSIDHGVGLVLDPLSASGQAHNKGIRVLTGRGQSSVYDTELYQRSLYHARYEPDIPGVLAVSLHAQVGECHLPDERISVRQGRPGDSAPVTGRGGDMGDHDILGDDDPCRCRVCQRSPPSRPHSRGRCRPYILC